MVCSIKSENRGTKMMYREVIKPLFVDVVNFRPSVWVAYAKPRNIPRIAPDFH